MTKNNLLTILGFKFVWLCCFFGEIYFNSFLGFFSGIIFLLFFIFSLKEKLSAIKIIFIFALIGYSFDSLLSYLGFYVINAQVNILFLPLWFLILWPSFCCLFINVLTFLKSKRLLALILGSVGGPLSYYSALSAGLATVMNIEVFLLISLFWALIMFAYSKF